jgi:hypothetical protein
MGGGGDGGGVWAIADQRSVVVHSVAPMLRKIIYTSAHPPQENN